MMKYLENMEKRRSYHLALNFNLDYFKIEKIIWKIFIFLYLFNFNNMVVKTFKKQVETTNTISKLEYYFNE
jgi:hypothetical protein